MVQIIRNPSGFAGYSVNPNTGTFTAPFMGYTNQRIPLPIMQLYKIEVDQH